jgi:hypothetical protein
MSARHLRRGTHRRDVELAQPEKGQACRVVGAVGRVPQVRCAQSLGSVGRNDRPAHNPADDAAGTCLYPPDDLTPSASTCCRAQDRGSMRWLLIRSGTPLTETAQTPCGGTRWRLSSLGCWTWPLQRGRSCLRTDCDGQGVAEDDAWRGQSPLKSVTDLAAQTRRRGTQAVADVEPQVQPARRGLRTSGPRTAVPLTVNTNRATLRSVGVQAGAWVANR